MKLLVIISVVFDITDQLLIRCFAFVMNWRKNGSSTRQGIGYSYISRKTMFEVGKHLSNTFSNQNGLKEGCALKPMLFNFALEYVFRKV
jgi:hypothetical protein